MLLDQTNGIIQTGAHHNFQRKKADRTPCCCSRQQIMQDDVLSEAPSVGLSRIAEGGEDIVL